MNYKCSICGYVYDETKESIPFADLPDDWRCPMCGAPKSAFMPIEEVPKAISPLVSVAEEQENKTADVDDALYKLSMGQMAALCSNLSRGCEKLYMPQESALFKELAEWFTAHAPEIKDATVETVIALLQENIEYYPHANEICLQKNDRGARRVLGWSEKSTRMLSSLMERYKQEDNSLLADTEIWVCSACGFVFIGKTAPEICPVCKVPSWRFDKVERRKLS